MSSLGPWLTFALQTAPAAAVLVFVFVFFVAAVFIVLSICAGDPNRTLRILLLLGPIAGIYCGIYAGGLIAIAGWPIMQILERAFGLSSKNETWVISLCNLSYISIGMDALAAVGLVIILLAGAILRGHTKEAVEAPSAEQPLPSARDLRRDLSETNAQIGLSKMSNTYRRIGIIAGCVFSGFVLAAGLFLSLTQHHLLLFFYFCIAAAVIFIATYGSGRLLGWGIDSFFARAGV